MLLVTLLLDVLSILLVDGGVLYVHIHAATNLIGQFLTHQSSCDPYCLVHCMNKVILTTHTIPSSHNPIWEKGVELLVPSYRSLSCHFHVYSKRVRGSELIGAAELCVNEVRLLKFFVSNFYSHCLLFRLEIGIYNID